MDKHPEQVLQCLEKWYKLEQLFCNQSIRECYNNESCLMSWQDELLGGKWSLPVDLKGNVFSCKLKEILAKPFDEKESTELLSMAARRKPVMKLRQTRGRTMQVSTKDQGLSYLDHHPGKFCTLLLYCFKFEPSCKIPSRRLQFF